MGRPVLDGPGARVTVAGVDPETGAGVAWSAGVFSGEWANRARWAAETGTVVEVAPGFSVVAGSGDVVGAVGAIVAAVGPDVRLVGDVPVLRWVPVEGAGTDDADV